MPKGAVPTTPIPVPPSELPNMPVVPTPSTPMLLNGCVASPNTPIAPSEWSLRP
jgi:hypothetical protein